MRAIRPTLSIVLLAAILLFSEGIAVSLHWCCGTLESLAVFSVTDCCCDASAEHTNCALRQPNDCCTTTTTYLLLPLGSTRTDEHASLPSVLSTAMGQQLLFPASVAVGIPARFFPPLPRARSSPALLQRFRL